MDERGSGSLEDRTEEVSWHGSFGPWMLEIGSPEGGRAARLERDGSLTLGTGRDVDVRIRDATVSARHCVLRGTSQGIVVEDLGSRNGVFVGAARVARATLSGVSASIVIGHTTVVLRQSLESDESVPDVSVPGLVGTSACMRRVADEVRRHARLKAPILIRGESGTGKDVVARALHQLSGRSGSYVPLNVGTIPEALADAELFGHRRGAFTGAIASRAGAFEEAHGGSLFLDEIAELPPSVQVKLLRVVEDGQVRPMGSTRPIQVEVRIISATWASLEERAQDGRFRSDSLHRLSTVTIELPPLRQRTSDIPILSKALLARNAAEVGERRLSSAALARLVDYDFPGNVRELASVLYRAAVAAPGAVIEACHLQLPSGGRPARATPLSPVEALALLNRHRGNATAAARAARVPRSTFRAWLDRAREEE